MNNEFVALAEYDDELEAQMVQSALFDADIDAEIEQERPRGMNASHGGTILRVMVRPHDVTRARKLIRNGMGIFGFNPESDLSDLDAADFGSSDSLYEF